MAKEAEKTYKVMITEIDVETGESRIVDELECSGMSMLLTNIEGSGKKDFCEVMIHEHIAGLATKIASSKNFSKASMLANVMQKFTDIDNNHSELGLLASILGGSGDDDDE